ncbi:MAG: hypothetical protein IJU37_04815 [Desulfovibrio sp.]|nr:hypothetical protein [Desulfovibrio sp.]
MSTQHSVNSKTASSICSCSRNLDKKIARLSAHFDDQDGKAAMSFRHNRHSIDCLGNTSSGTAKLSNRNLGVLFQKMHGTIEDMLMFRTVREHANTKDLLLKLRDFVCGTVNKDAHTCAVAKTSIDNLSYFIL